MKAILEVIKTNSHKVVLSRVENEKEFPSEYICNFLEPGPVSYEDAGAGISFLSKETILKIMPTFKGKPIIEEDHKLITPKNFKRHAVGYVTDVWWDDLSQWAMAKVLITDDSTKRLISEGYSVSCAFKVTNVGAGGEWHAIKYDEEILDGEGEHIAVVLDPRYEGCRIVANSKAGTINKDKKEKSTMLGLFKKKENAKSDALKIDLEKTTLAVNGKQVSIQDLIAVHNSKATEVTNDSIIVDENGVEHRVGDLVDGYIAANSKKKENASDDDEDGEMEADGKKKKKAKKENASEDDDDKENSKDDEDEEKEKKKDAKKKNAKDDEDHAQNAVGDGDEEGENPETTIKRHSKENGRKNHLILKNARATGTSDDEVGMIMPSDKLAMGALYY